jgi:hypothetical protein
MLSITENKKMLKFVKPFAAGKNEIRYYLQGVCFEHETVDKLRLTASNGHVLASVVIEADHNFEPGQSVIIDIDDLKVFGEVNSARITGPKTHTMINDMIKARNIDGRFPNWRVIMKGLKVEHVIDYGVDPGYMSLIGKAFKSVLGKEKGMLMSFHGASNAIKFTSPLIDGFAIVMPCRMENKK